jgi:hypothetical protein
MIRPKNNYAEYAVRIIIIKKTAEVRGPVGPAASSLPVIGDAPAHEVWTVPLFSARIRGDNRFPSPR